MYAVNKICVFSKNLANNARFGRKMVLIRAFAGLKVFEKSMNIGRKVFERPGTTNFYITVI